MKNCKLYRCGGLTLVEIMVAVGVTVGMMLMIGTVFKSATDTSGVAMANNELMGRVRTLTNRLDQDFSGLRSDMPMAIIFEAGQDDPDEPAKVIRYDRICFFANGDFHDIYGSWLSGNLARIFYGQMSHSPSLNLPNNVSPPRQVLARRYKIMTAVHDPANNIGTPRDVILAGSVTCEQYDSYPFETASVSFWKNQPVADYRNFYFNQRLDKPVSFVRPPNYDDLSADALQQLYFLSDVTDLKIQLYLYDEHQSRWRWFPDEDDFQLMSDLLGGRPVSSFAMYWNVPYLNSVPIPRLLNGPLGNNVFWWSDRDIAIPPNPNLAVTFTGPNGVFTDTWPQAIRFTFTLYDKHRRRFPEGQTFSYIIKVPPRN